MYVDVSSGLFDRIHTVCIVNEDTERKPVGSPSVREGFLLIDMGFLVSLLMWYRFIWSLGQNTYSLCRQWRAQKGSPQDALRKPS